ncbi:MAG: glycosyltransferase [Flavobacteriaceae bacterium]|nr:glycosyltransferase [Flavobacteriaceae bacterium]MCY4217541.1 glycosyltransferase [Flavobacteriaceae bacterium]MCY4254112.1 glycosyltransferase [Flavobacteriaceae bacterium]
MGKHSSIVLIGPALPFRGGISETQHQFALSLIKRGHHVQLWTFTKLYPQIIFPGSSQYSTDYHDDGLNVSRKIHAYNPMTWKRVAQELNKLNPQIVVFRYYTPLLTFCYRGIMKLLDKHILKIGFVDNWVAHEKRIYDGFLNKIFAQHIDKFSALSENVASQIASNIHSKPIWHNPHPISKDLYPKIEKTKARKQLGWNQSSNILLFYGIIRKYKGLDVLLRSLSRDLLDRENIELKVVGDCYQSKAYYRKLIKSNQLDQKVQCYFQFAGKTLTQLVFSAADLLVLPYRSATQSGIIPLSYHYDLPLVVSDVEGIARIVKRDQSGLVSKHFPSDFYQTIISSLQKEKIESFKANILKSKSSYDWDYFTEQWISFVNSS